MASSRIAIVASVRRPETDAIIYSWRGYEEHIGWHSILRYCDTHAEKLREKYGRWIHDLASAEVGGARVVEKMAVAGGFSAWWTTVFVEKSPFKSPAINDAIRLFALEEILLSTRPASIELYCDEPDIEAAIQTLCKGLGIMVEAARQPDRAVWSRVLRGCRNPRSIYDALPLPLRGGGSLAKYILSRWRLSGAGRPPASGEACPALFCSYFFNIAPAAAAKGEFHSRYWEDLHALMRQLAVSANWLHLYYPHAAVPNAKEACRLLLAFNRSSEDRHSFLDSFLSPRVIVRVLWNWGRMVVFSARRRGRDAAFRPKGSHFSLWPIMQQEWRSSCRGPLAVQNLLWIELFDACLRVLPRQRRGFYLCENQGWERAFIHSWRKHGHGLLTAVPHSTRSFWDLRFYNDPRAFVEPTNYPLPHPDRIAVNGPAALAEFQRENYAPGMFIECEALRYGYLRNRLTGSRRTSAAEHSGRLQVLLLGEYSGENTTGMLALLEKAAPRIGSEFDFTLKPHPNAPQGQYNHPAVKLSVVDQPLAAIVGKFDVAICGNTTSAAVDAYVAGLFVIVVREPDALDFSPLRGKAGAIMVGTSDELIGALQFIKGESVVGGDEREVFFSDANLRRWRSMLLD